MNELTSILLALWVSLTGFFGLHTEQAPLGAFSDPFLSIQLATSPSSGLCLTTDGTNNSWGTCAAGGTGLATSSPTTGGQVLWYTSVGAGSARTLATTTVSCSGSASCNTFTVLDPLGAGAVTISATGGAGGDNPFTPTVNFNQTMSATSTPIWARAGLFASTTSIFDNASSTLATIISKLYLTFGTSPNLLYIGSDKSVQSVATSSIGAGTGLSFSGTAGAQVGGTAGTYSVNTSQNIATLSNLTTNGVVFTSGSNGTLNVDADPLDYSHGGTGSTTAPVSQILYGGATGYQSAATTTLTGTAPITFSNAISVIGATASVVTCAVATGSVPGCLAAADFTTFSAKSNDNFTHPTQNERSATTSAIGIGTTTPFSQLAVSTSTASNPLTKLFTVASSTGAELLTVLGSGNIGIGTSTPTWLLNPTSSTLPQLALSAGPGFAQWFFRNSNETLYIGTTTVAGNATTSTSALQINSTGGPGVSIGSTTPWATLAVNPDAGNFSNQFVIGSSSATSLVVNNKGNLGLATTSFASRFEISIASSTTGLFIGAIGSSTPSLAVDTANNNGTVLIATTTNAISKLGVLATNGKVYMSGLTTSAGLQTGIVCLDANNQLINESVACVASSQRFKTNINYHSDYGLDVLMKLKPVSFYWKPEFNGSLETNPNYNGEQIGLIAEDVAKVDPRLVVVETKGQDIGKPHSVRYENMVALLIAAVQEQQKQIDQITGKTQKSIQDNWQWAAIFLLFLSNIYLLFRKR